MSVLETRCHGQIWVYPLEEDGILVGSDPRAHVSLPHPSVGAFHCRLRKEAGTYVLCDLSGGAGTFLNGRRVREKPLRDRDLIQLGSIRLAYADSAVLEGPRVFWPAAQEARPAEDRLAGRPIATRAGSPRPGRLDARKDLPGGLRPGAGRAAKPRVSG